MGKEHTGFGMVFRPPYSIKNLLPGAKGLYGLLTTYRDKESSSCYPTDRMLSEDMGVSIQQIQRWLQNLEDNKVIRRDTRRNNNRGTFLRYITILDEMHNSE